MDASIKIPQFKVLIDIRGVPPPCYREKAISRAIGAFGVYLGTVEQDTSEDLAVWTVAVATEALERIPQQIIFVDGGLETPAEVYCRTWSKSPLYTREELPKPTKEYTSAPSTEPPADFSSSSENNPDEEDTIQLSVRLIRQLCSEKNAASIPQKLRDILAGHTEVSPPPPPPQVASIPVPPQRDLNAPSNNHEAGNISKENRATHKPVQQQPHKILDEGTREFQTDTEGTEGQNDSLPPQNSDMHAGEGSEHPPQITRPM